MKAEAAAPSHGTGRKAYGRAPVSAVVKSRLEEAFEDYLIRCGYAQFTNCGNMSTIPQYLRAVNAILEEEGLCWAQLPQCVEQLLPVYDAGGAKEHIGSKSNKTYINALRRFREFCQQLLLAAQSSQQVS